jgi:hypothetical protein
MQIVTRTPQNFKQDSIPSPDILSTIDLIDHMVDHHQDEALALVELAQWHQEQAEALGVERRMLAADVTAALAEAERLLK